MEEDHAQLSALLHITSRSTKKSVDDEGCIRETVHVANDRWQNISRVAWGHSYLIFGPSIEHPGPDDRREEVQFVVVMTPER